MPPGYDREYATPLDWRVRRRIGLTTETGDVTRFVGQLESLLDSERQTVARFDHDELSVFGLRHGVNDDANR